MFRSRDRKLTPHWVVIAMAACLGLWLGLPQSVRNQIQPTAQATSNYVVNTTDDHDDGVCNAADCTLREAINAANAPNNQNTAPRNVNFAIPGSGIHTINVNRPLPQLGLSQIEINGPTLNGTPLIEINGANAGSNANGLSFVIGDPLGGFGSGVHNLIINRFGGHGISVDAEGVRITGCSIGTNAAGTAAAPNGTGGIRINNLFAVVESNVVSGNKGNGIDVVFGDPIISSNFIGTNAAGTAAVANTGNGIKIENNLRPATVGSGNVISGNGQIGIQISGASGPVLVQNNFIGTSSSATIAIPNRVGIDIENADGNKIIGNTIFGNNSDGVQLNSSNNMLQGNFLSSRASVFDNQSGGNGVTVNSGNNNIIGGTQTNAGNVISGNVGSGIAIAGGSGTLILGNFITANVNTYTAHHLAGVSISGGSAIVGGTEPGSGNVISGNTPNILDKRRPELFPDCCPTTYFGEGGVYISGGAGSQVLGNFIGTNSAGTAPLGDQSVGVTIDGAANNIIGGATAAARNIIARNLTVGVKITGAGATNNVVQGNLIQSNLASGVAILNGASNNTIGGTVTGAGNTIANNGFQSDFVKSGAGVLVQTGSGNAILGNSIFSNGDIGIDLGPPGVTPNDNCESAVGPNIDPQNFPVITSATADSTTTTIRGTLNSAPNTQFRIEFFANSACDPSGNGEGETFLGFTKLTTDASCNASFSFSAPNSAVTGPIITATATNPNNNTSEFSACVTLVGIFSTIQLSSPVYTASEGDKRVDVTIVRTTNSSAAASVNFATSDLAFGRNCDVTAGIASSRCDYESSVQTVNFAPGETSKNISIFLIDDSYKEGNENFTVALSNPAGAFLGVPSTATVTITDNDVTNGPNPIDTSSFFVRQHYLDFLNREADQAGLSFWANQITSCGADQQCLEGKRITVSAAFFFSVELQETGYLVERVYKVAYGNATSTSTYLGNHTLAVPIVRFSEFLADTQEVDLGVIVLQPGWEQLLEINKQAFTLDFVQRPRFTNAFPTTLTPAQFVNQLFVNAGFNPSDAERNAAIAEFGAATNTSDMAARSRALRDVAENPTLKQREFNRAFVLFEYFDYLRRDPYVAPDQDYSGYDFWLTKLNQFNGDYNRAEMVKSFIASGEYRRRFGP